MRAGWGFASGLAAVWLALFGLVALVLHYAVLEVICIEIAALVLAVVLAALLRLDYRLTTGCGHCPDCESTR